MVVLACGWLLEEEGNVLIINAAQGTVCRVMYDGMTQCSMCATSRRHDWPTAPCRAAPHRITKEREFHTSAHGERDQAQSCSELTWGSCRVCAWTGCGVKSCLRIRAWLGNFAIDRRKSMFRPAPPAGYAARAACLKRHFKDVYTIPHHPLTNPTL